MPMPLLKPSTAKKLMAEKFASTTPTPRAEAAAAAASDKVAAVAIVEEAEAVADTTPATVVEATVVTKVAIMEATEATSRTVEVMAVAVGTVVADKAKVTGEASKTPTTLPAAVAVAAAAVGKPTN